MLDLGSLRRRAESEWQALHSGKPLLLVGNATCGRSAGSLALLEAVRAHVTKQEIDCTILETGCIGLCYIEPLVAVLKPGWPGICYGNVAAKQAPKLLDSWLLEDRMDAGEVLGSFGPGTIGNIPELYQTPVLKPQVRRTLQRCGFIDPTDINHYFAQRGYSGLERALSLDPQKVIDEIREAGLRGRGGAGFPTWKKWQFCRDTLSDQKYLICNADEGDPGAFMNRALIEGDPHALIEGMIIAAYTLGAEKAYIYCRAEYPLALERLRHAISQSENLGLLGENILGSGFNLRIRIKEGAGAFVCGEETALIHSIEGERGMPTSRPPFPAVSGLWGKPTIINNVETLAYVGQIMQNSATWFTEYGSDTSKGTKTIALVGKVKNTGLVEVPLGITMRELIFDIGGGIKNDRNFKAVQTGGPSGGCLPESLLDITVDYDSLNSAGTIMGSGGVVVMDDNTCMVDFARYFLDFAEKESCGKCTPCRLGTRQLRTILEDITEGRGRPDDIATLEELAAGIKTGSLCGLGQTAPNPVLSTLRYFREEYEEHIRESKCRARQCKAMISYFITDSCVGCGYCLPQCASGAISGDKRSRHQIDQDLCCKCGVCFQVCPPKVFSIEIRTGSERAALHDTEAAL